MRSESTKLIKYFLTSLTVAEDNMWVNLSPYEKNRIIPDGFGRTEMGRDLLAQDYLLKQLTASMIYPEDDLGKEFWERVYTRAQSEFGTTDIPVNTFNKIWIVPERANVYVNEQNVFVVESHLKVMLEEDYLALAHNTAEKVGDEDIITGVASDTVREVLIPEIEREVNQGRTFANLRQIYHAMILATWYKRNLKESFLNKIYTNQERTAGVENADDQINQKIYEQYVTAFKEGVYNYVKEEYDPGLDEVIPKKYFSGGVDNSMLGDEIREVGKDQLKDAERSRGRTVRVMAGLDGRGGSREFSFRQAVGLFGADQFSLKRTYRLGDRQTLFQATFSDFVTDDGKERERLGVQITPEAVDTFKQTVNSARSRDNSVESLVALKPLISRLAGWSSKVSLGYDVRIKLEAIAQQIKNIPTSDKRRRNLIGEFLNEFNALSDQAVQQVLEQSLKELQSHLHLSRSQFSDWDSVRIDFQLNADDTYNIRAPREGETASAVLEVDAMKLMFGWHHQNNEFSWKMSQFSLLVDKNLKSLIESGEASEFVRSNPELVREVARMLLYVKKLDNYRIADYSLDATTKTSKDRDRRVFNRRIQQLNEDQSNNLYTTLFRRLRNLRQVDETRALGAAVVGDTSARINAVVDFIFSKPALRERAGVTGEISAADVEQIQSIIQASDARFLNVSVASGERESARTQVGAQIRNDVAGQNVKVVTEQKLIGERTREPVERRVPQSVSAYSVSERTSGDQKKVYYGKEEIEEWARQENQRKEQEQIVFIPLNVSAQEYLEKIVAGTQVIRGLANDGVRVSTFLNQVWPQFLIANAHNVASSTVRDATLAAAALIGDSALQDIFSRLVQASTDVKNSKLQINEVARDLRNNPFLRQLGIYTQVEVISRRQNREDGSQVSVDLISSQSFQIDSVESDFDVSIDNQGNPAEILYLGERVDQLDQDISALGFTWIGDTFGVVLKDRIADETYSGVLPHLQSVDFRVAPGQQVHPLSVNIRTAIQRDYPTNPSQPQIDAILDSRYRSTGIHERQHTRDEINGVQRHFSGRGMRIAQETTAYLSSIAFGDAPFTDLVKVIELNISLRTGFGVLSDLLGGGVYSAASENILKLFADRLGVEGFDLGEEFMLDSNARLLEAALQLSSEELKVMAEQILNDVIQVQMAGRRYNSEANIITSKVGLTETKRERDRRLINGLRLVGERIRNAVRRTKKEAVDERELPVETEAAIDKVRQDIEELNDAQAESERLLRNRRNRRYAGIATVGIVIAALGFYGTYTKYYSRSSEDVDLTQPLDITQEFSMPEIYRDTMIFEGEQTDIPFRLGLEGFKDEFLRRLQDTVKIYEARPEDNIVSVAGANAVETRRGSTLSGIAKMYFDDYFRYPEIHSANQEAYNLEALPDSSDWNAVRGFYNLPTGIELNVPGGINITYEVQPGENLSVIAQRFYGIDARGAEKPLVEFDGVGNRWIWQRIADANGISAPYAVQSGQKITIPTNLLEYQRNILATTSDTTTKTEVENKTDNSMLGDSTDDFTKGGIDLNPNNMQIESSGSAIEMSVPEGFKDLQNISIEGFVPVIINIVPVNNLPLLLGNADDEGEITTDAAQNITTESDEAPSDLLTRLSP